MSLNGLNYEIEPVLFALLFDDLPAENDNVLTQRKNKKKESSAQPVAHRPKGSGIRKRSSAVMPNTFGCLTSGSEIDAGSLAALFGLFRVKTSKSSLKQILSYPPCRDSSLKFPFGLPSTDFTSV
jgi:hypothetical protein